MDENISRREWPRYLETAIFLAKLKHTHSAFCMQKSQVLPFLLRGNVSAEFNSETPRGDVIFNNNEEKSATKTMKEIVNLLKLFNINLVEPRWSKTEFHISL